MVIRTGVDILEIARFEKQSPSIQKRFFKRVFTTRELSLIKNSHPSAAGRFASKEAVAKALGCGIGPVRWQDIEILQNDQGEPSLILHNEAIEISDRLGIKNWSLSISHSKEYAVAFVVGIGDQQGEL